MGQAKKRREAAVAAAEKVDLAPLANPDVRAAVLAHMIRKGIVK